METLFIGKLQANSTASLDKNISAFWTVAVPHLLLSWRDENNSEEALVACAREAPSLLTSEACGAAFPCGPLLLPAKCSQISKLKNWCHS